MIPFLVGRTVYLRPLDMQDLDGPYPYWFNDAEVCAGNSHHVYPFSVADGAAYIEATNATRAELVLAVCLINGDIHVGNVALQNIHSIHRSADFSIVIGEPGAWNRGYGTEAGRLIIDHGFKALGLNRIACGTFATNQGMVKLAGKLGFKPEGVRRHAAFKHGAYLDVVEYGLLQYEWKG